MSDGDGETDTATVTITVTDANEAPAFDPSTYDFSVAEDAATDDVVGTVMAGDEDTGDTLTYSHHHWQHGQRVLHRLLRADHRGRGSGLRDDFPPTP